MSLWESIPHVQTGITLIAFIVSALAWVYVKRGSEKLKLIDAASKKDRPQLIREAMEFFFIDATALDQEHQFELAKLQIDERAKRFRTTSIVITIGALILAIVTVIVSIIDYKHAALEVETKNTEADSDMRQKERDASIRAIEVARRSLQDAIDSATMESNALIRGLERINGMAEVMEPTATSMTRFRNELNNLLVQHNNQFGRLPPNEAEKLQLNMSLATIENSLGNHKNALTLITEKDLENQRVRTEKLRLELSSNTSEEISIARILGAAYLGQQRWDMAEKCYIRIINLSPERVATMVDLATCKYRQHRNSECKHDLESIITIASQKLRIVYDDNIAEILAIALNLQGLVESRSGRWLDALLKFEESSKVFATYPQLMSYHNGSCKLLYASVLKNRASMLDDLDRPEEAIKYNREAVSTLKTAANPKSQLLANYLAISLMGQATTLKLLGDDIEALKYLEAAEQLYKALIINQGHTELNSEYAQLLDNRGLLKMDTGAVSESLGDFDLSLKLLNTLYQNGRNELRFELASVYNNRALAHLENGKFKDSLADLNVSLDIRLRLSNINSDNEINFRVACTLGNRSQVYNRMGQLNDALNDANKSIGIFRDLVEGQGLTNFLPIFARQLSNRGSTHIDNHNLTLALNDLNDAIGRLEQSNLDKQSKNYVKIIAVAKSNRGVIYGINGTRDSEDTEVQSAIELFESLERTKKSDVEISNAFAKTLIHRAFRNAQKGVFGNSILDLDRIDRISPTPNSSIIELKNKAKGVILNAKDKSP